MSKVKHLISQVRTAALKELEYCNPTETPTVCQLISTAGGKQQVVDLIVEYVGKNGMSISEAIVFIERERNPKLSEVG